MKALSLKVSTFLMLFALMGAGCEKEEDLRCYKGKVVSINQQNSCHNIIEIIEIAKGSELMAGNTISFETASYKGALKIGNIVFFKIIEYEDWVGPATANCLWPQYVGQIEICNN